MTGSRGFQNLPSETDGGGDGRRNEGEIRGEETRAASEPADVPSLFRINVEVGNLDEAVEFYGKLFGLIGRKQAGSRCYFTCGAVTLQVVDVSSVRTPHPAAKALYFVVNDLEAIFERAKSLQCLSQEEVHGCLAARSACSHGASARSTPRIVGTTRFASWRPARSIRVDAAGFPGTLCAKHRSSSNEAIEILRRNGGVSSTGFGCVRSMVLEIWCIRDGQPGVEQVAKAGETFLVELP